MEKYQLTPISNLSDALEVIKIRNECRLFMTNHTSYISQLQQKDWYENTYIKENKKGNLICFLFKYKNENVGFGLIRKSSEKYWITGGLAAIQRGKGLGRVLFEEIIKSSPSRDIWLEVLDSNFPAKKLYNSLGFKKVKESENSKKKIIIMSMMK